jgi:hypothetical protein
MSDSAAKDTGPAKKPKAGWLNVLIDYGPLLVFFLTYRWFKPEGEDMAGEIFAVVRSTGAFIAAALVALAVSKWRLGPHLADAVAVNRADRRVRRDDDVHGQRMVDPAQADRDLLLFGWRCWSVAGAATLCSSSCSKRRSTA